MKLIDRISIHRLLQTMLNFILTLAKILAQKDSKSDNKRPLINRWRKNKNEQ